MGMAPTAGKCVDASITSAPAGVMGRPSPAGSCWPHAAPQKTRQITRKPLLVGRDFIGMLLRFLKTILSTILWCRPKTTSPKSKGKLFHKLYNTYAEYGRSEERRVGKEIRIV